MPLKGPFLLDNIKMHFVALISLDVVQGVFLNWYPPKKLKYGKPRIGESTLT